MTSIICIGHDHLSGQSFGQLRHPICGIPLLGKIAADIPSSRNAASGMSRLAEFFDRKGDHSPRDLDLSSLIRDQFHAKQHKF